MYSCRQGRLTRDVSYKGKGIGELLLADAPRVAWQASRAVGSWAVTVEAKDDRARRFYLDFGFVAFADTPHRLYIPMKTVAQMVTHQKQA